MKVRIQKIIGFNEADTHHQVRLKHLFNYLQEAAATHSRQVGYDPAELLKKGYAWVLNKVGLTIKRLPKIGDEVEVVTWHKGVRGFRSYRDYQIKLGDETLVSATSLWLFIDTEKKKIIKPPSDVGASYTIEGDDATDVDLDAWRPVKNFDPDSSTVVTTRPSDFDPLGHANNSAYVDYLEVMLCKHQSEEKTVKRLVIQYLDEIQDGLSDIQVTSGKGEEASVFSISAEDVLRATGKIEFR